MAEPVIVCPHCKKNIKLTESLAAPLVEATKKQYERQLEEKEEEFVAKERRLKNLEQRIVKERESINTEIEERLQKEKKKIAEEERKKAEVALSSDLTEKEEQLREMNKVLKLRDEKLAEAQKAQADLMKRQRALDEEKRELELTVQKRIQQELGTVRDKARKEAEDELKLKVMEKEQTISSMQKQIEELKRKSEQGSQQLQGEVQELELESILKNKFPMDRIESVAKGEHGGDVLQYVVNSAGQECGTIIWESKRTKAWSDTWLPKLREDQRTAKAEIAVILTQALPKEIETFGQIDGVWVTGPKSALPVAHLLRQALIEVAATRQASDGQQTKMEMVYQYLTGPRFRQRVQAIVEAFSSMKEDLDREKKAIFKQWAKREEQIERVMQSTVGMFGDLQGIAGKSIQEIEGLDIKALEE